MKSMKKKMRKALSVLLVIVLLLGFMPGLQVFSLATTASAEDVIGGEGDIPGDTYRTEDDTSPIFASEDSGDVLSLTTADAPTVTGVSPNSGPAAGGTTVTITGTNLTGATAVKFGSTNAASYNIDSATQITATSPAGTAGTVYITVTTAGGTSATGANRQFTYVAAAPTVTTAAAADIGETSATLGGNVTADGGATVTECGAVYSATDTTPEIGETGVTQDANGSGTGAFSESITGLTAGATYYFRAYATNTAGTSYGDVLEFTTAAAAVGGWVGTGWNIDGLNYNKAKNASNPSVVRFNGKWYAAWEETNSSGVTQIRAAERSDDTGEWSFIDGGGVSGLNYKPLKSASIPKLTV